MVVTPIRQAQERNGVDFAKTFIIQGFTRFSRSFTMPIYAYRCEACGFAKDVLQKMSDAQLTVCPTCHQESFKKQVTAAGFQLKGTGWYVTDFRGGAATGKSASGGSDDASSSSADSAGEAKPASPAATPAAGTTSAATSSTSSAAGAASNTSSASSSAGTASSSGTSTASKTPSSAAT